MAKAKQLNNIQADSISADAAIRAIGFGPTSGTVTIDAAEIIRLCERAAQIALDLAGHKADANKAHDEWMSRQAAAAKARHAATCKRIGISH